MTRKLQLGIGAAAIAAFVFAGCGGSNDTYSPTLTSVANPDFAIGVTPSSATVIEGDEAVYTVTLTSIQGFDSAVNLSVTSIPTNASANLNPSSTLTPTPQGAQTTLTIETDAGPKAPPRHKTRGEEGGEVSPGAYTITVTGTSGSLTHSQNITLIVTTNATPGPASAVPMLFGLGNLVRRRFQKRA